MRNSLISKVWGAAWLFLLCFLPKTAKGQGLVEYPFPPVFVDCSAVGSPLQDAIDAAGPNTSLVVDGTCNENVIIREDKRNLALVGAIDATSPPTINGGAATNPATVQIRGRGIYVLGFASITGGLDGILVLQGGSAFIDSNRIHNTGRRGIGVIEHSSAVITNNTIEKNAFEGIFVNETSAARIGVENLTDTSPLPNAIQNNGTYGVLLTRGSQARIVGNFIAGNAGGGVGVIRKSQADVSQNEIGSNGGDGIFVSGGSGVNPGNTNGTTIFDLPNNTTVSNLGFGLRCIQNSYAVGRLGTLNGASGAVSFAASCIRLDSDGDGMPDDFEFANGLDINNPADAALDTDVDGLTNLQEFQNGTNPNLADTDGDGAPDGLEVAFGTDPLDPASFPPVSEVASNAVRPQNIADEGFVTIGFGGGKTESDPLNNVARVNDTLVGNDFSEAGGDFLTRLSGTIALDLQLAATTDLHELGAYVDFRVDRFKSTRKVGFLISTDGGASFNSVGVSCNPVEVPDSDCTTVYFNPAPLDTSGRFYYARVVGSFAGVTNVRYVFTQDSTFAPGEGQRIGEIVAAVNALPTISNIANQVVNEDTATAAIAFTVGDFETAAAALVVSGFSSNTAVVPNANILFGGSGANRTVTITPAPNQFGTTMITVTVQDANGPNSSDTFLVTVNPVNDAPVFTPIANQVVNEGQLLQFTFSVSDAELEPVSFVEAVTPAGSVLTLTGPNTAQFSWTPDPSQAGTYLVSVTVTDGQASATQQVSITVNDTILDTDLDGVPDAFDLNGDGIIEPAGKTNPAGKVEQDNCSSVSNPGQSDVDKDGWGDNCDNSPTTPNPDQADLNNNEVGDVSEGQVTATLTATPPTSSTGFAPQEPILINCTVTFHPADFTGDGVPDPYYAIRPNPFNCILDLFDLNGNRVFPDRIPEAPPVSLTGIENNLDGIGNDDGNCEPGEVCAGDLAYISSTASQTFSTQIDLTQWFTNLEPGNYSGTGTYVNYLRDPDVNPDGTCSLPDPTDCFDRIWMGIALAAEFNFTRIDEQAATSSISDLSEIIGGMSIPRGLKESLLRKLSGLLERGNVISACHSLGGFINEVNAQKSKGLTAAEADNLINRANEIKRLLACG